MFCFWLVAKILLSFLSYHCVSAGLKFKFLHLCQQQTTLDIFSARAVERTSTVAYLRGPDRCSIARDRTAPDRSVHSLIFFSFSPKQNANSFSWTKSLDLLTSQSEDTDITNITRTFDHLGLTSQLLSHCKIANILTQFSTTATAQITVRRLSFEYWTSLENISKLRIPQVPWKWSVGEIERIEQTRVLDALDVIELALQCYEVQLVWLWRWILWGGAATRAKQQGAKDECERTRGPKHEEMGSHWDPWVNCLSMFFMCFQFFFRHSSPQGKGLTLGIKLHIING